MIIEAEILCYNRDEVSKGLPEREFWAKSFIDLSQCYAIKQYINDENEVDHSKSVLYFCDGAFTVNMPFKEAQQKFSDSRNILKNLHVSQ